MVKGIVGGPNAIYGARVWTEKSHAFCAKNFSDITWHMTSLSKQKHRSRFHQGPIDISRHSIWTYDVITVNSVTMYGSKLSPGYFFHHIFLTPRSVVMNQKNVKNKEKQRRESSLRKVYLHFLTRNLS